MDHSVRFIPVNKMDLLFLHSPGRFCGVSVGEWTFLVTNLNQSVRQVLHISSHFLIFLSVIISLTVSPSHSTRKGPIKIPRIPCTRQPEHEAEPCALVKVKRQSAVRTCTEAAVEMVRYWAACGLRLLSFMALLGESGDSLRAERRPASSVWKRFPFIDRASAIRRLHVAHVPHTSNGETDGLISGLH